MGQSISARVGPAANDSAKGEGAQSELSSISRLRQARAWVFDMDGVLYRGSQPLTGVNDLFNALRLRERPFLLATNNSTASPDDYVAKLHGMGFDLPATSILTSGTATRGYLLQNLPAEAGIYVIGMPALREQIFTDTGFRPVQYGEEQPDAVVVGLDFTFSYEKLKQATIAIRQGACFIATNPDATLPTESGLMPGSGSIISSIVTATGQRPVVVGKPEPLILLQAIELLGVPANQTVMVGDRLDTDIVAGERAGMLTAMVLTGASTRDEIPTATAAPDLVFTDLPAILEALTTEG